MNHEKHMKWSHVAICGLVLCVVSISYDLIFHRLIDWGDLAVTLSAYLTITVVTAAVRKVNKKLN